MLRPTDVRVLIAVAVGGALGALARYGIAREAHWNGTGFPWATFATNLIGCLVIGFLIVSVVERPSSHELARPFLVTGVLGGFTTFSTFALETRDLLAADKAVLALTYVVASVVLGVLLVAGMRAASLRYVDRDAP